MDGHPLEARQGEARTGSAPDVGSWFEAFLREVEPAPGQPLPGLREWVELAEAWRIVRALRDCRGNRSAAARSLGIGRRTLYAKMERLGIEPAWSRRRA